MSSYRRTNSGVSYRTDSGYIFDSKGNIIGWCKTDGRGADYEEQINELRAEIESIKQKQDKEELKTMGGADAAADIEIQVNTKQIENAKKEIDKALKNLF